MSVPKQDIETITINELQQYEHVKKKIADDKFTTNIAPFAKSLIYSGFLGLNMLISETLGDAISRIYLSFTNSQPEEYLQNVTPDLIFLPVVGFATAATCAVLFGLDKIQSEAKIEIGNLEKDPAYQSVCSKLYD